MNAKFISHPDFYALSPLNVFHKEYDSQGRYCYDSEGIAVHPHPSELKNRHIIYRRRITLDGGKAKIRISADDYYKLYINGRFVCQGPSPAYPHHYYFNEVDVTDYLTEGENFFAVHTYYQGLINRVWVSGDLRQMLWLELIQDGVTVLVSDENWLCKYHTAYTPCGVFGYDTAYAECYDASSPDSEFYLSSSTDDGYVPAKVHGNPDWCLFPQPTAPLEVYRVVPEKIERTDFGYRLALSGEVVGYLSLTAKGSAGDRLCFRYAEELLPDGSARYDMRCNCRYEEYMLLSGGTDKLMQYDYKAFRYVDILAPDGVELSDISVLVRHYPFERREFYNKVTDPKLRAVIELCANTVKYGAQEQFLDCMTREKGAYLGDLMVSGRAHAILTGDTSLLRHAVQGFVDSSFICPGLMAVNCSAFMQEIADYSLEFPAIIGWIYSVDGDIDFVRSMAPYARGVYEYFRTYERPDGLIEGVREKWNMVDWPENLRDGYAFPLTRPVGSGVHNVINALWYGCKRAIEEINSILGINADLGTERTLTSFMREFYVPEYGFVDMPGATHGSVQSSVFPLLFGIGCEDEAVRRACVEKIREKKLTSMGVYMAYFALAALKLCGEDELCHSLATDPAAWLNMIAEGATVTFEAWGKEQKWNTSLFHPWAVAPLVIFSDSVRPY